MWLHNTRTFYVRPMDRPNNRHMASFVVGFPHPVGIEDDYMSKNEVLYSRPSQMEPMLPPDSSGELREMAIEVVRRSAALGAAVHRETARGVAELVRSMNSYYSNLIEGHNTHPVDIEKALAKDYSGNPAKRALQMESAAHIEVQRFTEQLLEKESAPDICSKEFLCRIHRHFYDHLPEEFKVLPAPGDTVRVVIPGKLRDEEVEVGKHLAPAASSLPLFLDRFSEIYNPAMLDSVNKVLGAAASHHRLAWIHPFLDGNGRVARIFTHAYLLMAGVEGHGMWAISRGLARHRTDYLTALAEADEHRRGDLDGRGNLSEQGLVFFCRFFLKTALDQIDFMRNLLDLDGMQQRIGAYAQRRALMGELPRESGRVLQEAFLRGKISRGEASLFTGKAERTGRRIVKQLLDQKLLQSDSEKGPLKLAFPVKAVGYYFPRLYPEGVEFEDIDY